MKGTVNGGGSTAFALKKHAEDTSNPHKVKADQIMMVNDDGSETNLQSVVRQMKDYVDEQESVSKAIEGVPTPYGTLTYTGEEQTVTLSGFDPTKMTVLAQSVQAATNAGKYKVLVQPKTDFYWSDNGRNEIREVEWEILPQMLASEPELSSAASDLVYTGETITPAWTGINSAIMTCAGGTSGTSAGPYTMTVILSSNYCWMDGTTGSKSFPWSIAPKLVAAVPTQSGTLTFTGSPQSPTWAGFDSEVMTATGTQSASGAGGYTVTFSLAENYGWPDGSMEPKDVVWTINKAGCIASLNKTTMSLATGALTDTITVTRTGDGTITASSSNSAVASVAVSGNTVTVTGKAKGSATITVSVSEGTNHLAPSNLSCAVGVTIISTNPDDNGPSEILAAARSGNASLIWKKGDAFPIALNGTVEGLTIKGTYKVFILDFNHNEAIEGGNSIHFMIGKNADGKDIGFCTSNYGQYNQTTGFIMNTSNTSSDGWAGSRMNKTTMPAFEKIMPSAWQNIITPCVKWTDNGSGSHNTAGEVWTTNERLFLLSPFEIHGTDGYANPYEKTKQKQYGYFGNGNSTVAYRHDNPGTAVSWWCRAPMTGSASCFCYVNSGGGANSSNAPYSFALRPAFKVA